MILAPMARLGGRAHRLDGLGRRHRRPLGPVPAPLRLLHPALRPGDQPAARRHPRGAGDLPGRHRGARGQPPGGHPGLVPPDRAAPAGHRPRRPGQAHVRQRVRGDPGVQGLRHRRPVPGGRRRCGRASDARGGPGPGRGHRQRAQPRLSGHRRRCQRHRPLRPELDHRAGPDPVAAAGGGRPPPPGAGEDPDPGRPGGRDRRRPRGAPHGPAHRLRRRRRQPLPGPRVDRRHDRRRPARGGVAAPGPPELHQGRLQGRAQGDVQDGHLHRGLLHRGPGLRGGRPRPRGDRRVLHRDGQPHRRAWGSTCWPPRWPAGTAWPTWTGPTERAHRELEVGGEYQWRREGEFHLFNPKTVFKLQHATRAKRYDIFKEYSRAVDDQSEHARPRCGACCACGRRPTAPSRSKRSSRPRRS